MIKSHPLTNFEIQKYYRNKPSFNGVFSRNNLPEKIKDGTHVISLDEYAVKVHTGLLYFVIEMKLFTSIVLVLKFIGNKNIIANIFRVQANNSTMRGYFCTGFIDFMLAGKTLTDFTSLFSPYDLEELTI